MPTDTINLADTICEGAVYPFFGNLLSSPGTYTAFGYVGGECETFHLLHLTVLPDITENFEPIICEGGSIIFQGNTIFQEGTYTFNYTTTDGHL